MEFQAHQALAVPPEVAFDLLADLRNQAQWGRAPIGLELLTGEPIGPGSRFRAVQGGRAYEATITTYAPPELLSIEVRGAHLHVKGDFLFAPAGPGAVLDAIVDIGAKGPMRLVLPSLRSRIGAELPEEAAGFAGFCDRRAPRPES